MLSSARSLELMSVKQSSVSIANIIGSSCNRSSNETCKAPNFRWPGKKSKKEELGIRNKGEPRGKHPACICSTSQLLNILRSAPQMLNHAALRQSASREHSG